MKKLDIVLLRRLRRKFYKWKITPDGKAVIAEIYNKQEGKCNMCKRHTFFYVEGEPLLEDRGLYVNVDHIIPLCFSGSSDPSNLQILCVSCNGSKGIKI